jgi:tRNA dimethylallyltransferase
MTSLRFEVLGIFGPTASGKSDVAERLAKRLGSEVVSADALQVYRGLEILTNQPHEPTRLVGIRALSESMSVGEYAALAHAEIDALVDTTGSAVVAGGTGLYLRAALADLEIPPAVTPAMRLHWERAYDEDPDATYARLIELDPASAATIHRNDRRRVVRGLELAGAGSSLAPGEGALWSERTRRPTLVVGLEISPEELERRIAARTDDMLRRGVTDEVRAALRGPISRTARQALGFDELASLSTSAARERIILRTRRYATYQRKWMRRIPGLVLLDAERSPDEVVDAILHLARAR